MEHIRQMTFEEVFESRVEYFYVHKRYFYGKTLIFLQSVADNYRIGSVTKKQMQTFNEIIYKQMLQRLKK